MTSSLVGKRVLVPRGKKHAKSFSAIVESYGGIPVEVPLLDFRPIQNKENLGPILHSLHTYDWLIFTSEVTVATFFSLLGDKEMISLPRIAVIGDKTEEALNKRQLSVHFKPKEFVAESFVEEFSPFLKKGEKILLPKGNLAREYIAQFFREKGLIVDEAIIYETYFPEESKEKLIDLLKNRKLDVLPFTSPSTIEHFMSVVNECKLRDSLDHCIIAVIGPVSKKKCEELGLPVHVMPEVYTSYGMITEVVSYLSKFHNN